MSNVPDNFTFSLQDVYNSVYSHDATTQKNFSSCVAKAVSEYYDVNYSSEDGIRKFRNYTPVTTCSVPSFVNYGEGITMNINNIWVDSVEITMYYPTLITNNMLIMIINTEGSTDELSTPSGWTKLGEVSYNISSAVYYRKVTGTEGATVTISNPDPLKMYGIMYQFSNVGATLPELATSQFLTSSGYGIDNGNIPLLCGQKALDITVGTIFDSISCTLGAGWVKMGDDNGHFIIDTPTYPFQHVIYYDATTTQNATEFLKFWSTNRDVIRYLIKLKS